MHLFLDANALFSDWQRAIWLALADSTQAVHLYHSETVLDECFRNLIRLGHLTLEGADIVRQQWQQHPSVSCIHAFDAYFADVRSVHEKDRHVAAAALKARHERKVPELQLLTWNVRDFPRPALKRVGVIRLSPDDFLLQMFKQDAQATQQLLDASLALAQTHRHQLQGSLTAYQQRASGFPKSANEWSNFLKRTGFRQLGNAYAKTIVPPQIEAASHPLHPG